MKSFRAPLLLILMFQVVALRADELNDKIKPLIDAHKGEVTVAIKDLKTGEKFEYKADEPMPTASLIKFPLMIAAYQAIEDG
jgi:beta-lactamase class A